MHTVIAAVGARTANTVDGFKVAFVISGVLAGFHNTAVAAYGVRLFPRSHFAQFASAGGMAWQALSLISGPLIGMTVDLHGNEYRYVYGISAAISFIAVLIGLELLRRFKALGGDANYTPPVLAT